MAVDDGATTPKTTPVRFNLTDNDTDPDGNGTIDKDSIVIATPPNKGLVTVHNDGTGDVTYDWNRSKGKPTSVDFQYTVDDTDGATSNLGLVTVTFGNAPPPANQAPTANPDTYNTPVATTLNRPPPACSATTATPTGMRSPPCSMAGPPAGR